MNVIIKSSAIILTPLIFADYFHISMHNQTFGVVSDVYTDYSMCIASTNGFLKNFYCSVISIINTLLNASSSNTTHLFDQYSYVSSSLLKTPSLVLGVYKFRAEDHVYNNALENHIHLTMSSIVV